MGVVASDPSGERRERERGLAAPKLANTANIPFFLALVEAHYRVTGDLTPGLGCLKFEMFNHIALAVGSYNRCLIAQI